MEKKSFILYCDFKGQIDLLSYEEKGMLLEAIFDHECGEPIKDLPPMVKMAFANIELHLKRNGDKWKEIQKARSEAGKKSGEARRNKKLNEQNETKRTSVNFVEHNVNDNVNDNVNVNDNANVNEYYYYYKGTDKPVDNFSATKVYVDNFGKVPTKIEVENIKIIYSNYDKELVDDAFEIASQQDKKTVSYVKGILNKQRACGIYNMADLADYEIKKGRV